MSDLCFVIEHIVVIAQNVEWGSCTFSYIWQY